jgi:hypothetical protein
MALSALDLWSAKFFQDSDKTRLYVHVVDEDQKKIGPAVPVIVAGQRAPAPNRSMPSEFCTLIFPKFYWI